MKKIYKVYGVIFSCLLLSACHSFESKKYQEPTSKDNSAKITFAKSTRFFGPDKFDNIFSIDEWQRDYMNTKHTSITFDPATKNRDFGIPVPKESDVMYNVYVPANQPLKFTASIAHDWFWDVNSTSSFTDRRSMCVYANTTFTPEKNGEYLVFIDNVKDNTRDAPRCSLVIKQLVKNKSQTQWVDVEYHYTNRDSVMSTWASKGLIPYKSK